MGFPFCTMFNADGISILRNVQCWWDFYFAQCYNADGISILHNVEVLIGDFHFAQCLMLMGFLFCTMLKCCWCDFILHNITVLVWFPFTQYLLTHWGRVTHICVSKPTIIGSDNGLSPGWRQAIIWTNAAILLIGSLGTNFRDILIDILAFSFKRMHLKISSVKWQPFCLGLNVLIVLMGFPLTQCFSTDGVCISYRVSALV